MDGLGFFLLVNRMDLDLKAPNNGPCNDVEFLTEIKTWLSTIF